MKAFVQKFLNSKFSRDTLWLIAAQVVLLLTSLSLNIFIGQHYGVAILGIFNQSLSFYLVLSTLLGLGLNTALTKKAAEDNRSEDSKNKLLTACISTTFILSTVVTGLFIAVIIYYPNLLSSNALASALLINSLAIPFYNLNRNFASYFSGKRLQKEFAIQRIIRWTIILVTLGIGIFREWTIDSIMYGFLITESALLIYNIIKLFRYFDFSFRWSDVTEISIFGIQCYISGVISILNNYFDLIILGYFLPKEELGVYSFIVFCTRTLYVFPGIIMQNVSPIVSNLWEQNKIEELKIKIGSIRRINLIVISVQMIFLIAGYKLLIMFLKQEFSETFGYFLISSIGVFLYALISWSGGMLVMAGKPKENILRSFVVIVFSLISLIVFSHLFGLLGACIAIFVNGIVSFLIMKSFIFRILGIRII